MNAPPAGAPGPGAPATTGTDTQGLASAEAQRRLAETGPNELQRERVSLPLRVLWNQLRNPLLILLAGAALVSAVTHQWIDAAMVIAIMAASVALGCWREYGAQSAAARLHERIQTRATVVRDGSVREIALREVVPGDIFLLSAGSLVPADGVVLEAVDCFINESALTGESYPVQKRAAAPATPADHASCVFLGTDVRSGSARCRVVATGRATRFGSLAKRLAMQPPETGFDRGMRHFGYLLGSFMFTVIIVVFVANLLLGRELLGTLMFSIALAVGLSPELLPAILTVNLARGAQALAARGVLVRRLNAIESLGSMDILCTDKTGTLTEGDVTLGEGDVTLGGACDSEGRPSRAVLQLAACNSLLQSSYANPIDAAIAKAWNGPVAATKLAEIPYDFVRKRISVLVRDEDGVRLVTKGAFDAVVDICTHGSDGAALDAERRAQLLERVRGWSEQGARVLAVATRRLDDAGNPGRDAEREMQFAGFLTFTDPLKQGVAEAVRGLKARGVTVKMITGDHRLVALHVATGVGLGSGRTLTGAELDEMHDDALERVAPEVDLFAQVDPIQKERIIRALRKSGHIVAFLGDGINDAPAMHAADTSLSVNSAVDVAREAADFVLLERDLGVVGQGIDAGRATFANTLKYIVTTGSANLGNMTSMALASLLLPFLPLLASQVLLNNFLSDIPAIGLAQDRVDDALMQKPQRWDIRLIGRCMLGFGLLSSLFDLLTFWMLLVVFSASMEIFRTGWFVESLLSELLVALVVRTRLPVWRSTPAPLLVGLTAAVAAVAILIPYLPSAGWMGFAALPAGLLAALLLVTLSYAGATEMVKTRLLAGGASHGTAPAPR